MRYLFVCFCCFFTQEDGNPLLHGWLRAASALNCDGIIEQVFAALTNATRALSDGEWHIAIARMSIFVQVEEIAGEGGNGGACDQSTKSEHNYFPHAGQGERAS